MNNISLFSNQATIFHRAIDNFTSSLVIKVAGVALLALAALGSAYLFFWHRKKDTLPLLEKCTVEQKSEPQADKIANVSEPSQTQTHPAAKQDDDEILDDTPKEEKKLPSPLPSPRVLKEVEQKLPTPPPSPRVQQEADEQVTQEVSDAAVAKLTLEEVDVIIKAWKEKMNATTDSQMWCQSLGRLFKYRSDIKELVNLCLKHEIKMSTFLRYLDGKEWMEVQPLIAGHYLLHVLENNIEKFKDVDVIGPLGFNEPRFLFGKFLAENCPVEHFEIVLSDFLAYSMCHKLGEGFFVTLIRSTDPNKLERIRAAFSVYWTVWEKFDIATPKCSELILPEIKSEEVLEAIVQALPQDPDLKAKIFEHLKSIHQEVGENQIFGPEYRIDLPQDVINRIVK